MLVGWLMVLVESDAGVWDRESSGDAGGSVGGFVRVGGTNGEEEAEIFTPGESMNMKASHRRNIAAKCPMGCIDVYAAEFLTNEIVMVEDIDKAIAAAWGVAITQEELTQKLADITGCRVVTNGRHGVYDTTVEASPSR